MANRRARASKTDLAIPLLNSEPVQFRCRTRRLRRRRRATRVRPAAGDSHGLKGSRLHSLTPEARDCLRLVVEDAVSVEYQMELRQSKQVERADAWTEDKLECATGSLDYLMRSKNLCETGVVAVRHFTKVQKDLLDSVAYQALDCVPKILDTLALPESQRNVQDRDDTMKTTGNSQGCRSGVERGGKRYTAVARVSYSRSWLQ